MLFNGKYYNKPGHLGMTRAELLEKLNGGGGGGVNMLIANIEIGPPPTEPISCDKTFAEMKTVLQNGGAVIVYSDMFSGFAAISSPDTITATTLSATNMIVFSIQENTITKSEYLITTT